MRTAVPRLRITTRYVPGAPAGAEGTQQQPLPPVAHPHRVAGGEQGGGVALATVRRCHCTAAVAAHIERSQRCQLPPAGAAGGTGDNFCATGGGRLASAGARSSGRTPRERRNKFWPIRQQRGGRCAGGVPGQPAPTAGLSEHRRGSHAGGAGWGGYRFRACAVLGKKWIKRG